MQGNASSPHRRSLDALPPSSAEAPPTTRRGAEAEAEREHTRHGAASASASQTILPLSARHPRDASAQSSSHLDGPAESSALSGNLDSNRNRPRSTRLRAHRPALAAGQLPLPRLDPLPLKPQGTPPISLQSHSHSHDSEEEARPSPEGVDQSTTNQSNLISKPPWAGRCRVSCGLVQVSHPVANVSRSHSVSHRVASEIGRCSAPQREEFGAAVGRSGARLGLAWLELSWLGRPCMPDCTYLRACAAACACVCSMRD